MSNKRYIELASCFDCSNCHVISGEVIRCIKLNSVINTFDGIPADCKHPKLAEVDYKAIKKIAVDFYRFWHNAPGTNTDQGFDEWWEDKLGKEQGE